MLKNRFIVTEEDVEKALEFLTTNAQAIGTARRNLVLAEKRRAHVEALEMKKFIGMSAAAQTREARASDAYLKCIEAEAEAAGEFEMMKALREAEDAKIKVFQTESANSRGLRI